MEIVTTTFKKILLLFILVLFALTTYVYLSSKKLSIPAEKITIEKHEVSLIAGFYHFSTLNVPWRHIVMEQMTLINRSGLFNASSNIYVTGLGKIPENKNITDIFAHPKFIYEYNNTHPQLSEYPALSKLEKFCLYNNKSLVWYAHSKGATHPIDDMMAWRGLLNHFVLDKWRLCSELLFSTNYTTCGALLGLDSMRQPGWNTYYAGNMWWAKCSHINRLTRVEKLDQSHRYTAELYVTSEPAIGHFNCHTVAWPDFTFDKEKTSCKVNQPLWKIR